MLWKWLAVMVPSVPAIIIILCTRQSPHHHWLVRIKTTTITAVISASGTQVYIYFNTSNFKTVSGISQRVDRLCLFLQLDLRPRSLFTILWKRYHRARAVFLQHCRKVPPADIIDACSLARCIIMAVGTQIPQPKSISSPYFKR